MSQPHETHVYAIKSTSVKGLFVVTDTSRLVCLDAPMIMAPESSITANLCTTCPGRRKDGSLHQTARVEIKPGEIVNAIVCQPVTRKDANSSVPRRNCVVYFSPAYKQHRGEPVD